MVMYSASEVNEKIFFNLKIFIINKEKLNHVNEKKTDLKFKKNSYPQRIKILFLLLLTSFSFHHVNAEEELNSYELTKGIPTTNLSGLKNSQAYFTMAIPAAASDLQIVMSGGSGDADL